MRSNIATTSAKHKGWVLEGYPKTISQFNKFVSLRLNPHLVIILDEKEDSLKMRYGKTVIDTETFQSYESYELPPDFKKAGKLLVQNQKYAGNNIYS